MTIGIGLLCCGGKKILLCADTRASFGEETRNDYTGKLFNLPFNFFGAIAGSIGSCEEIISELHHRMDKIPDSELGGDIIHKTIRNCYSQIYTSLADETLRGECKITLDQYLHDQKLVRVLRRSASKALQKIEINVDLIVAGFIKDNPVLIAANGGTSVITRTEISPGNALIGSGAYAALNWLNYRKQNFSCGLARSLFHLTEAKQFAEVESSVGPLRQIALLWPGGRKGLEGGYELIQGWWNKYGLPQSVGLGDEQQNQAVRDIFGIE
jgi:20S proteasome alpha/beta subunit